MITDLVKIYERDLDRLKLEIELFNDEKKLWSTTGSVKNSAGNLALHLVGNLKTYIGKNLGKVNYTRDRDAEFNLKNVPKESVVRQVEETKTMIISSLPISRDVPVVCATERAGNNRIGRMILESFILLA